MIKFRRRDSMTDVETMLQIVKDYEYVSFDMFDTLMFRTVPKPEDIFDLVEHVYNSRYSEKITTFRNNRVKCEITARDSHPEREITFDEIYSRLPYTKSELQDLAAIEKELEISNVVPNMPMIELYRECIAAGKSVVIVTDMYLDRSVLESILKKIGIESVFRLFISAEEGVTKKSGKLFPVVVSKLGIQPEKIIHMGDNEYSDIRMAKEAGITAKVRLMHKNSCKLYSMGYNTIEYKHLNCFLSCLGRAETPEDRLGYSVMGPVCYEFCKWIHMNKQKRGYRKVFFVSREGYLLKMVYDKMYPNDDTTYIYLNKNLLRFPVLNVECTVESLLSTMPMKDVYSVSDILEVFGVAKKDEFIKEYYKDKVCLNDEFRRNDIIEGKHNGFFDILFKVFREQFATQYEYLCKYMIENEITEDKCILVNNSINGNGQILLSKIFKHANIDADILGMQFVRSRKCRKALEKESLGWLTDSDLGKVYTMLFNRYALLLEHMMFEPSGTALRYEMDDGGRCFVVCAKQKEELINNTTVHKIQQGALDFVSDYADNADISMGNQIIKILTKLYGRPYKEDAVLLSDLYDEDYDGTDKLITKMKWRQIGYVIGDSYFKNICVNIYDCLYDYVKCAGSCIRERLRR